MFLGRLCAWILLAAAAVLASADAVMAFSPHPYERIATADMWLLLVGSTPEIGRWAALGEWPAWVLPGLLGTALLFACRTSRRRRRRAFND
ncbi:hypothetical protein [Telmatospirillum sp. J64-1]|uniref:hypothetical protein n=1 Tax=Telmatospirillum sp. J64-1 TaxID=2502183 RepID=UPI00115D3AD3|nr:hypothetical protein [Telmatospirillum sp. J64-1]